ncbi:hypothetical protein C6376_39190 [Streptomyces sp. P3]|uniref:hypothetical protein n=1 Tax=Streptomyces sp. P3 TaxID=2135430 RepID=UPI000D1C058E|nr:hypothetical protein [Streptomyces sp. P3]AVV46441.1 hypothetical protein C6376_38890 [Streptomyces sp. P3]AVV46500.1 hypothetical protein C6376_39190 [Streptomyces sp. P3]
MSSSCEPGSFCPDHPHAPWSWLLAAVGILGVALFAAAAVLLAAAGAAGVRRIRWHATRHRRALDRAAAAIARVRHGHDRGPDGRCDACGTVWPCHPLCLLAGAPCSPGCEDRHGAPPDPAPPRPHQEVMAAAVEDWWRTTDPAADIATGPHLAAYVEMYLRSSGYCITPNP